MITKSAFFIAVLFYAYYQWGQPQDLSVRYFNLAVILGFITLINDNRRNK